MKVFRENEREIWLGMIPGFAALGALWVGAFISPLDFGQDQFRGIPGLAAYAIATLGLSATGTHPRRKRWMTFAFIASIPALVRLAPLFRKPSLARIIEVHTASGRHAVRSHSFPGWVPSEVRAACLRLSEAQARRALGTWV